jgi:hypothetical protein
VGLRGAPDPACPRLAVLVQPGHTRHKAIRSGNRANPGDCSCGGRRNPQHSSVEFAPGADPVGGSFSSARDGTMLRTCAGHGALHWTGRILCIPTQWKGRIVLRAPRS